MGKGVTTPVGNQDQSGAKRHSLQAADSQRAAGAAPLISTNASRNDRPPTQFLPAFPKNFSSFHSSLPFAPSIH